MTKKEIVDTLIAKMREQGGRCATSDGKCSYDMDGKKCLFSMALTDEARDAIKDENPTARTAFEEMPLEFDPETAFLPGYEGYDVEFWQAVQDLHDQKENWNANLSLTVRGKDRYSRLVSVI